MAETACRALSESGTYLRPKRYTPTHMHVPGAWIRVESGQKETDHRYVKYVGAEHITRRELGVGPTISTSPPYKGVIYPTSDTTSQQTRRRRLLMSVSYARYYNHN